ncbi:MAG: ATP-binding protein [Methylococcales bacterium]|nr:ATP-binding protein [Methylococcales bacterium]
MGSYLEFLWTPLPSPAFSLLTGQWLDFHQLADLLFELISRRHEQKSTLVTTNKSFAEWSEVFPNAACVVALMDRLVHNAEIMAIKGKSYSQKEAQERAEQRSKKRKSPTPRSPE